LQKKDDDTLSNDVAENRITLIIDNGTETVYPDITGSVLGNKLVIGGSLSNSDIQIILDDAISQGTYTSGTAIGMSHGVNSTAVFTTVTNVTSLSFVVSSHNQTNKHIKGNFTLNYDDNQNNNINHTATGTYEVTYH